MTTVSPNSSHLSTRECLFRHLKIHFSVYTIATSFSSHDICLGSEAFPLKLIFHFFFILFKLVDEDLNLSAQVVETMLLKYKIKILKKVYFCLLWCRKTRTS